VRALRFANASLILNHMAKHGVMAAVIVIALSQLLGCGAPAREYVPDDTGFAPAAETATDTAIDTTVPDATVDTGGSETTIGDTEGDSSIADTEGDSPIGDSAGDAPIGDSAVDAPTMDAGEVGPTTSVNTGIRMVSGGMTATNSKYRLVTTTGQVPGNSVLSGSKYILKGGLVGVTQP